MKDKNKLSFELCAEFSLSMQSGWQEYQGYNGIGIMPMSEKSSSNVAYPVGGINESWNHEMGKTCFSRTIDKDIYPPYSKMK